MTDKKNIPKEWDGTLEAKPKKTYKVINIEENVATDFKAFAKKNNITYTKALQWLWENAKENWEHKQGVANGANESK